MAEAIVEHDYSAKQADELTIKKGDVIKEVVKKQEGWCEGVLDGKRGLFPDNFVMLMQVKMRANSTNSRRCRVIYSYKQEHEDELSLNLGEIIEVVGEEEEGWWKGRINGKVGVFPSNFVEEINENGREEQKPVEIVPVVKEEPKTIPVKTFCEVKYAYQAQNSDELTLKEGDIVTLISKDGQDAGWWRGELDGKVGVFPDNFVILVEKAPPPAPPTSIDTDSEKVEKRPVNPTKPTHVATQRKSQEVKPVKLDPPAIPNKKPSVPHKKSPSGAAGGLFSSITKKIQDTIDGGASSKSVKITNNDDTHPAHESYHAFDNIERNPVLQDPRANRVKGPGRRPASVALKEGEGLINGNSDYGSLEDGAGDEDQREIKPRSIDVQKPPWLEEMNKKMNKRSTVTASERVNRPESEEKPIEASPAVDMSRSLPPAALTQTKPKDVKEVKTASELERVNSIDKVILRSKPVVNVRPQTIDASVRKTSPTIPRIPSPSPPASISPLPSGKPPIADRSSVEMLSSRHFNELNERLAAMEAELNRRCDEFAITIEDLRGRLQVETDMRMLLQVELEKLQEQLQLQT